MRCPDRDQTVVAHEQGTTQRQPQRPSSRPASLRYSPGVQKLRTADIGKMLGAISYGPAALEPHHTDLYWYGIHATEALYTVMGTGCTAVSRVHTAATDVVTGVWSDGRTGVPPLPPYPPRCSVEWPSACPSVACVASAPVPVFRSARPVGASECDAASAFAASGAPTRVP